MESTTVAQPPRTTAALFQLALAAHRAGKPADAEPLYREALQSAATDFESLHGLGALAAQTGQLPLGIELVHKAIAIRPDSPDAHSNLGEFLRRRGDLDDAAASIETWRAVGEISASAAK